MRSPYLAALFNPLNIAMLGLSLAAGLCAAWWLLPVGLLCWIVMVAAVARNPALRLTHSMQQRVALAPRFQKYLDQIERSQIAIFNAAAAADPRTQRALQPVQDELNELVSLIYSLGQRMTALENLRLVAEHDRSLEKALAEVNKQIDGATDALVRQKYEESRSALQTRLANLAAVSTQLDRMEAQLSSVTHDIDVVQTEVINLQAQDPERASKQAPELSNRLHHQFDEVKLFESVTEELKPLEQEMARK